MKKRMRKRIAAVLLSLTACFSVSFSTAGTIPPVVTEFAAEGTNVYDITFDNPPHAELDFGRTGDQYMRGQGFVAVSGGDMQSVEVKILKRGEPSDLIARLYACDSNGWPEDSPLAEVTLPAEEVPAGDTPSIISIPLQFAGLNPEGRYMVALGQEKANYENDYLW